ncbi:hypothetical protein PSCLAVI8L_490032 [Pseudoclavibacter sp. 8L]|nr:hypothetical protein PSCLAVI8L_490032 [Pseudoclavibacter sp. 8L]
MFLSRPSTLWAATDTGLGRGLEMHPPHAGDAAGTRTRRMASPERAAARGVARSGDEDPVDPVVGRLRARGQLGRRVPAAAPRT